MGVNKAMESAPLESVFVARDSAAEDVAEEALNAAGIEYVVTVEGIGKSDGAVCFLAMVYQVPAADAARARAVLEARGLRPGVVPARR